MISDVTAEPSERKHPITASPAVNLSRRRPATSCTICPCCIPGEDSVLWPAGWQIVEDTHSKPGIRAVAYYDLEFRPDAPVRANVITDPSTGMKPEIEVIDCNQQALRTGYT